MAAPGRPGKSQCHMVHGTRGTRSITSETYVSCEHHYADDFDAILHH